MPYLEQGGQMDWLWGEVLDQKVFLFTDSAVAKVKVN